MNAETPDLRQLLRRSLVTIDDLEGRLARAERWRREPIAVIGLGCRFPAGANDPEAFWRLLIDGVDAIGEVPADRWDVDAVYDPEPARPGKMYTRCAGLVDRVDGFDPRFFGIAPREAVAMDPQHRLLLEVAWEALEHAGQAPSRLAGSDTGFFVGISGNDYATIATRGGSGSIDTYFGSGVAHSIASGRLAYFFGTHGPCLSVDTACSSSLVAIHLAVQSLRLGECRLALAGGVNLILTPDGTIIASQARMLSPDGRCKTFDARADGYGRAEGCGLVVLKRLADAIADRDGVLAVIRGSAVNQDGRSSGITAPNGPAQEAVLRAALAQAGVAPGDVDYVETHGTGTTLGDPIEVRALAAVLGNGRPADRPLGIGSVKSNIGHLEAAAGVAGFIKAVMALSREEIPPHLHVRELNPHIPWASLPVRVITAPTPWPRGAAPRRLGVSSFGFSGTNAHVLLEEAPAATEAPRAPERPVHLYCLSARSQAALARLAGAHAARLKAPGAPALADAAFTAGAGRTHFARRAAAVAATGEEACRALEALAGGSQAPGLVVGEAPERRPEIAFLFTGQGSQHAGMGRELFDTEPGFRRTLERCQEILRPRLERPLLSVLYPEPGQPTPLDDTAYTQPALFALEFALAELLRRWGLEPGLVLGHSLGEYVAAAVAGVFTLEDGLTLVAERARLMQAQPAGGAMAAVHAGEARVAAAIAGYTGRLDLAAVNGPDNVVVSGEAAALGELMVALAAEGVRSQRLNVSHAFHSALMEPVGPELERVAARVAHADPRLGLVANATGRLAGPGDLGPAYWRRQLREPVQFARSMETLAEQGCGLFIEIGPAPTLIAMARRCLAGSTAVWLPTLRKGRGDWRCLFESLAAAYVAGAKPDFDGIDADRKRRRVVLPTYPFERERHWVAPPAGPSAGVVASGGALPVGDASLLGRRIASPLAERQFESVVGTGATAWLHDHRFYGRAVLPAAACVALAVEAGGAPPAGPATAVLDLRLDAPLVFASDTATIHTVLRPGDDGATVEIYSRAGGADGAWLRHAVARLAEAADPGGPIDLAAVAGRCVEPVDVEAYYAGFEASGVGYGPAFRGIVELRRGNGEALGRLRLPDAAARLAGRGLHPALLDAAFQVLGAAMPRGGDGDTVYMPIGIAAYRGPDGSPATALAHVVLRGAAGDGILADLTLCGEEGGTLAVVTGLALRPTSRKALARAVPPPSTTLYELAWPARPLSPAGQQIPPGAGFLLIGEEGEELAALAGCLGARGSEAFILPMPVPEDWPAPRLGALMRKASGDRPPSGVVFLGLTVGGATADSALSGQHRRLGAALAVVQAMAAGACDGARLWLVTRGAQPVGGPPVDWTAAGLWGLGRAACLEHTALSCTRVDLDPAGGGADLLAAELLGNDGEAEIALRGEERRVARLVPAEAPPPTATPVRLPRPKRGGIEELRCEPLDRRAPGEGEVEVAVEAAGLNFRDVLNVLGLYPGDAGPLGSELAGRVVAVGPGVTDLAPGEAVFGLAPAAFSSHVVAGRPYIVRRPAGLTAAAAATIPLAFLTAHYGFSRLAGLKRGQSVLIHAAAGGVGQAAVQLARRAGARIFATAGSEAKRAFLAGQGVELALDSRRPGFSEQVRAAAGGAGVDVVLNALTGAFIPESLSLLAPGGTFLELGKRDDWDAARVADRWPGVAYRRYDLSDVYQDDPALISAMFAELLDALGRGEIEPLPRRVFPLAAAPAAFRFMAEARHIGKVVLAIAEEERGRIRTDGRYLLTGGLGGLGLSLAGWLAEEGARHLVLVGRRPPSPAAAERIEALRAAGVGVRVVEADIAEAEGARRALEPAPGEPPLRGIVHAAGVLADAPVAAQTWGAFERVLGPKLVGALRLAEGTRDADLDFFVSFSSIAGLLGAPGQTGYAAANALLDALAHWRRSEGLVGQSIDWGPWADVGMAATLGEAGQRRGRAQGIEPLAVAEATRAFGHVLTSGAVQPAVLDIDWDRFLSGFAPGGAPRLFAELGRDRGPASGTPAAGALLSLPARLAAAQPGDRKAMLVEHVKDEVTRVLGLDPTRPISIREGLTDLGMDSLMAVELRDRLERGVGRPLPSTLAFEHPTIEALAAFLGASIGAAHAATPVGEPEPPQQAALAAALEGLSADEVEASLLDELEKAGY